MSDDRKIDPATGHPIDGETGVETTGHSWDGIEELNNPLPRWWLWTFYACTVWGLAYTVFFPAWPLVSGATQGVLGWSTRALVEEDIQAVALSNAALTESLVGIDLAILEENEDLHRFAVSAGASVFRNNCSQCHGAGAAGVVAAGYPNLLDDDWLWGGQIDDIATTVRHGIRNEADPDARWSEMPAFDEILEDDQIAQLVDHVRSLSGLSDPDSEGAALFLDNCAACHGDAGLGDREVGAPNLTDAIWLYGGNETAVEQTIRYSRFGVMPPWEARLGEAQIRAVAAYVHGLGGGERLPAPQVGQAGDASSGPTSETAAPDSPAD